MLCRRAVVQRVLQARNMSTTADLINRISATTANPLSSILAQEDDGPPQAGPDGYTVRPNPFSSSRTTAVRMDQIAGQQPNYRFDCYSTRNNTITTLSALTHHENPHRPPKSEVIAWYSGGSVGFKKGQRSSYEAGYQCAVRIFKRLEEAKEEKGDSGVRVDLYFRGFGQGREALKTALMATEGESIRGTIKRVIDRTALKIGGTRSKKTRRL